MITYILSGVLLAFIVLLFFPLTIQVRHAPVYLSVQWLFVTWRVSIPKTRTRTDWIVFGITLANRKRPKKKRAEKSETPEKRKPEKKSKRKSRKPFSMELLKDTLQHPAISVLLRRISNFLRRLVKSVTIKHLNADIGLKDYYLQGIIHGLSFMVPEGNIHLSNNYLERTSVDLKLVISIWKVLSAIVILLVAFPYLKTFRLYRSLT